MALVARYYDPTASGGNDGLTKLSAWQTIQEAADNAVAGEEVFCRDGGSPETPAIDVAWDINVGTATSPIVFTGCNSLWVPTWGSCEIIGTNGTPLFFVNLLGIFMLRGFFINGAGSTGIQLQYSRGKVVSDCKVKDCPTWGIHSRTAGCHIYNNEIDNCGQGMNMFNDEDELFENNYVHDCTTGIELKGGTVRGNLFVDNGVAIKYMSHDGQIIEDNTINGSTTHAIDMNSTCAFPSTVLRNRFTRNGGYAINNPLAASTYYGADNAFYLNTSGEQEGTGNEIRIGGDDISMSADFYKDRAGGDYTPDVGDEGIVTIAIANSALNKSYLHMGAIQPEASGGAGLGFFKPGAWK